MSGVWLVTVSSVCQAVKQLLELPLNLPIVSPAHTPNWDLVSDVVNSCSRIYRSPKQCRNRYENVIIPREEGKVRGVRGQGGDSEPRTALQNSRVTRWCWCGLTNCWLLLFISWCTRLTPSRRLRASTR